MKTTHLLMAFALLSLPAAAFAQANTGSDEQVVEVIVGDKGTSEDVELEFRENAPKRLNDNGLPRFAIVGHDNKFYLGIGAQFLGEALFDFGDEMPSPYVFAPSSITAAPVGDRGSFRFTALSSSFHLNFVALPGTKDRVGLFFKALINDNGGNSYGFDLFHFYVTYRGFQVGYTSSLFADGAAMPATVDFQGPNGSANIMLFTLNYTYQLNKNISLALGVEQPTASLTTGNGTRNVSQRIPAFPLYAQYAWGSGSHIRASALLRPMQYRNLVKDSNKTLFGWGAQLSGIAFLCPQFSVNFDATYGRGIAQYLQDTEDLNLDAITTVTPGKLTTMKTLGLTAGISAYLTKKLTFNATYSHLANFLPDKGYVAGENYRYGDYVAANFMYAFNKIISTGLEYDYGHRRSFDGTGLHVNRLQAQLAVTF